MTVVTERHDPLEKKRQVFLDKFLPRHPPVLREWFLREFSHPTTWYLARTGYVRTLAVMSIVGFMLGLGDRHGENILLDSTCGDIVHVDFNCLFNKVSLTRVVCLPNIFVIVFFINYCLT